MQNENIEFPVFQDNLPIYFGYKKLSSMEIECPECGHTFMQENMRAFTKTYKDGVTTGRGFCYCLTCRKEFPFSMSFNNDSSAEITVGPKVIAIPRGSFLLLLIHSIATWSRPLLWRFFPSMCQQREIPLAQFKVNDLISHRQSGNVVATVGDTKIVEWVELGHRRYYFDRIVSGGKHAVYQLAPDEVLAEQKVVYKLRSGGK